MNVVRSLRRPSDSLVRLRRELAERRSDEVGSALQELASEVQALKLELAKRAGPGKSCHGCAAGVPDVPGCFDGGLCCSGNVFDVFSPQAIAALALVGVKPRDLQESGDEVGCIFRGAKGCTLSVEARPALCVHYICSDLMAELSTSLNTRELADVQDRLGGAMTRFAEALADDDQRRDFEAIFD